MCFSLHSPEFQSKAQALEKKIQFMTMSLENTEQQEEHDDSEDLQENVTTKFNFHGGLIDWMKMQMNNMWKHFSGKCNMLSQNASIRDSMMEAESQRTNELKDALTESAQNFEKRFTEIEEHVSELRSEVISQANVINQIEVNEIKRTLEPQKTNSDDLSAEIASLKQKLEDILAESVQGLEELETGKKEFSEGILPGVISQASVLNQIEIEELKRTVESQRTDIGGSNGETASCEQSLEDTLAESVQGLEELATGKEECIEDIQSEFISQTSVMSQIEIEELQRTVESQRTDIGGSNGEILSLKQKVECKDSQIYHEGEIISLQEMTRSNQKSIEDRFKESIYGQEQEVQENKSKIVEMDSKFHEMKKPMADIGTSGPEMNKDIEDVMDISTSNINEIEDSENKGQKFVQDFDASVEVRRSRLADLAAKVGYDSEILSSLRQSERSAAGWSEGRLGSKNSQKDFNELQKEDEIRISLHLDDRVENNTTIINQEPWPSSECASFTSVLDIRDELTSPDAPLLAEHYPCSTESSGVLVRGNHD